MFPVNTGERYDLTLEPSWTGVKLEFSVSEANHCGDVFGMRNRGWQEVFHNMAGTIFFRPYVAGITSAERVSLTHVHVIAWLLPEHSTTTPSEMAGISANGEIHWRIIEWLPSRSEVLRSTATFQGDGTSLSFTVETTGITIRFPIAPPTGTRIVVHEHSNGQIQVLTNSIVRVPAIDYDVSHVAYSRTPMNAMDRARVELGAQIRREARASLELQRTHPVGEGQLISGHIERQAEALDKLNADLAKAAVAAEVKLIPQEAKILKIPSPAPREPRPDLFGYPDDEDK